MHANAAKHEQINRARAYLKLPLLDVSQAEALLRENAMSPRRAIRNMPRTAEAPKPATKPSPAPAKRAKPAAAPAPSAPSRWRVLRTITPAEHAAFINKRLKLKTAAGLFAKPGELQANAIRRLMTACTRHLRATDYRCYPAFTADMSTRDYVAAYERVNSGFNLICRGFYDQATLNDAPATLYEGGALDFAPIEETTC